jgi:hypothetical protein
MDGNNEVKAMHNYMVAFIYDSKKPGEKSYGSLVLTEEVDTAMATASELASFHTYLTNEISEYIKERVVILNIVRFN